MRYGIGDKIMIRLDLDDLGKNGFWDGGIGYDYSMAKYAGKEVTVIDFNVDRGYYRIKEDDGFFMWVESMLDLEYGEQKAKEERPVVEHNAVKEIDKDNLIKEMYDTLELCQIYHPTDEGLNKVINLWENNKGKADVWEGNSVLDILSKHPDYVPEKGYIVKKNEYDRGIDLRVIIDVMNEIEGATAYPESAGLIEEIKTKPWSYMEIRQIIYDLGNVLNGLASDTENMRYKERTHDEVMKERMEWIRKKEILEETYYVYNDRICFSKEDRANIKKVSHLINVIKNWAHEKVVGMSEEELSQPLLIDEKVVLAIEESKLPIRGIRVGQKFNKVIIKILTETKIKDKWERFNKETARLSDASSPTKFTRFTIISANPLDYWRMSFGSSWSSCHTIDKCGYYSPSDGGDGYEGMHASGTSSYMGDESSVVMYTVDKGYEGTDYELEPKINRCMFHLGEGKFVMGRVYPQGTDGEDEVYRQWRNIFQQIIAECMGVPNYWKTLKDRNEKLENIDSHGTHYRDYEMDYCNSAGWSYIMPTPDALPSKRKINIGSVPICPCCGSTHWVNDNIECENCNEDEIECANCGGYHPRSEMREIDGEYYCDECVFYCDYHGEYEVGESYYVEGYGDVCEYALECGEFERCEYCDSWFFIGGSDGYVETENGEWFCSESCARNADCVECNDGLWRRQEDCIFCEVCEEWVSENNWNYDMDMCENCASQMSEEETA